MPKIKEMLKNILKFELILLFVISTFSLLASYFYQQLPDHIFRISAQNEGMNIISYLLTSIVVITEYYTGPWILFSFFLCIVWMLVRRDQHRWIDIIRPPLMVVFCLSLAYLIMPNSLGLGLKKLLNNSIPTYFYIAASLLTGTILLLDYLHGVSLLGLIKKSFLSLWSTKRFLSHLRWPSLQAAKQLMSKVCSKIFSAFDLKASRLLRKNTERDFQAPQFVPPPETHQSDPQLFADVVTDDQEGKSIPKVRESKIVPQLKKSTAGQKSQSDAPYFDLVREFGAQETGHSNEPDKKYFSEITELIESKLAEFKIEGKIINVLKGPVVDTFELDLGTGVKVSKVTNASEDLSLALYGAPIRIVYPMKGRTTIGIEVPRNPREIIFLSEILQSEEFKKHNGGLPLAMGKNAFGETFVTDLTTMPHMLVAGATGAGKSVFINTLLVSLLIKRSPKQMQLILIDPKQLELALYSNLPHLVMPVITDAKTASISLMWACQEMERRYSILKEFGVRNIDGFNKKLKKADPELLARIHEHYEDGDENGYELPYLVIIVDEFADLILTKAGKEIENNICRLAAKARAAGIHLVLATQRPSVDVITGLIKSNFPTRVSFRVTAAVDSRTILNAMGAEKLLGKGDMLYKHGVETVRVHSSYVDENEIEKLTDQLSEMGTQYSEKAMDFIESGGETDPDPYAFGSHLSSDDSSADQALYDQAIKVVMEYRQASASMLQRRLRIGYNRAANLIEEMERKGVVGPAQGSKPRKVLSSPEMSP